MVKKILLFCGLCLFYIEYAFPQVSQEEAFAIIKKDYLSGTWINSEIYVSKQPINSRDTIEIFGELPINASNTSWFFFIDVVPDANWAHDCIYVFVDYKSGNVDTIHRLMPPKRLDDMIILNRVIPLMEDDSTLLFDIPASSVPKNVSTHENEYAIIISGGCSQNLNNERYWNDCSAIYKVLVNIYNYNPDNIYVIMSDGTDPGNDMRKRNGTYVSSPLDLDGNGTNDIQYPATHSAIETVFNHLQSILTNEDNVFIFTTDHGGENSTLALWNEIMTLSEFSSQVNKLSIAKTVNICMEQCYSGGFIPVLSGQKRVIATACTGSEYSYAMAGSVYDEFCFHWISAVAGVTPNGTLVDADSNVDGWVSMAEAFRYAKSHDTRNETPQYYSPEDPVLGNILTLSGTIESNLIIRDNTEDNGVQPNTSTSNYTNSPDIWLTTLNGSAINRIEEGGQYLIHVRVHNNDSVATSGNIGIKLNWSRVGSNMNWDKAWNGSVQRPCYVQRGGLVGEQSISATIVAGGDAIVSFPWTIPTLQPSLPHCSSIRYLNGLSYALLARVDDGHETLGEGQNDYNIRDFVLQNNNVAMKTYNILQENFGDNIVAVDMRRDRGDGIVRVAYNSTTNDNGTHISDVANVYLQFDSSMLAAWPQATRQMTGCRQVNDSVFAITDTTATFDGFLLDTAETYFISSYVRYRIPQADSTEHRFSLNFSIVDGDSVFADGYIDYTVMYDEAAYFNITAYEDMTVMAGESFELSAEADAADAIFEWYNMQDVLIGAGDHISLSTTTTQQYYVRGYSPSDNTVGYDTVMVTVKHGIITKITPNPAKNQVLVKYTLADDVTNPTISIRNSYGMVVYSASVGTHPAQCHVNLRTLPTGNYTVSLEAGGMVLDSKTLVVQ